MGLLSNEGGDTTGLNDDLSLVQTLNREAEINAMGEYDALHETVKDTIKANEEVDLTDQSSDTSDDTPSDGPQDTSLDTESDDLPVNSTDDTPEDEMVNFGDKKSTQAAEQLRMPHYDRLILEMFGDSQVINAGVGLATGLGSVASSLLGSAADLAIWLKNIGVQYAPAVFGALKRGVAYLFIRSVKSLLSGAVAVSKLLERRALSLSKARKELDDLKDLLKTIKGDSSPLDTDAFANAAVTDPKMIQWFISGGKASYSGSVQILTKFMETAVKMIDVGVTGDLNTVSRLIDLSKNPVRAEPFGLMDIAPPPSGFIRKTISGYSGDASVTESFIYSTALPNGVLFITNQPKSADSIDALSKAYQSSSMVLAVDSSHNLPPEKLHYMDINGVELFLNQLDQLHAHLVSHQAVYTRVREMLSKMKFGYQHYYHTLVESGREATIRSLLVEYVALKQSYVNKVYLPAAIDIDHYASAYLVHACRFVKANLKQLSKRTKN